MSKTEEETMKAANESCCICRKPAVEKSFDGTGWCKEHFQSWKKFLRTHWGEDNGLEDAFPIWLRQAHAALADARGGEAGGG